MIQLFRNIRRRLLMEGRNFRYLKYAFGEIVLVVIGILIALQINNWNENRKHRIAELAFAKSLLTDLKEDVARLDRVVEFNTSKIATVDSLMAYAGTDIDKLENQNDLYGFVRRSIMNKFIFINQGRNLARLPNMNDDIIRANVADSIASFQRDLLRIEEQRLAYEGALLDCRIVLNKLFKMYQLQDTSYFDVDTGKFTGKPFSRIKSDTELQDEFFNTLMFFRGVTRNYLSDNFLAGHRKKTLELIAFLESEYQLQGDSTESVLQKHN